MSFNEITRNLEDAGSREQRVRELAQSLQRRGLAMTAESARQLASSMVETERKVQKRYQDKKDSVTSYSFDRNQEPGAIAQHMAKTEPVREAPEEPAHSSVTEHYPELTPDMNVNEAAQESEPVPEAIPLETPEFTPEPSEPVEEEYPLLTPEQDHAAEPGDEELATGAVSEMPADAENADEEVSTEDFADESEEAFVEDDDKPEDPQAIPETEEKPREDLGKKHGIDISQMFNVNK